MLTAVLAVLLFGIMIFPHELGHFFVAKLCQVQVNQFSLGFGPAIFKKQKGETLYAIRIIPLGGYCAMEGENEETENPRAFNNKTWWQKILVLLAGSAMNVVVCFIILTILATVNGIATTTIGKVQDDSPAAIAQIHDGDKIVSIDGQQVDKWNDVSTILNGKEPGTESTFTVERDGQTLDFKVTPKYSDEVGRYIIGIETQASHNIFGAIAQGFTGTGEMFENVFKALHMLFTGEAGIKDFSGPVGIVSVVNQTVDYGLSSFFYLAAFISVNLAIINMLPLPALDGGRIVMVLIRQITGKKITDSMEAKIHAIGIIFLLGLFIVITWNDIVRLFQ